MDAAFNKHIVEEFIQNFSLEFCRKQNFWNAYDQIKDNIKMNLRAREKLQTGFIWSMAIFNEGDNGNDFFDFVKCSQFRDWLFKYYFLKKAFEAS